MASILEPPARAIRGRRREAAASPNQRHAESIYNPETFNNRFSAPCGYSKDLEQVMISPNCRSISSLDGAAFFDIGAKLPHGFKFDLISHFGLS